MVRELARVGNSLLRRGTKLSWRCREVAAGSTCGNSFCGCCKGLFLRVDFGGWTTAGSEPKACGSGGTSTNSGPCTALNSSSTFAVLAGSCSGSGGTGSICPLSNPGSHTVEISRSTTISSNTVLRVVGTYGFGGLSNHNEFVEWALNTGTTAEYDCRGMSNVKIPYRRRWKDHGENYACIASTSTTCHLTDVTT